MNNANETLREALAVARTDPRRALEILKAGLEAARAAGNKEHVAQLARHAGVISDESGDVPAALQFYSEARGALPEDAYAHLAYAILQARLGNRHEASSAYETCLRLAAEQTDNEMLVMATKALAALKQNPEQS